MPNFLEALLLALAPTVAALALTVRGIRGWLTHRRQNLLLSIQTQEGSEFEFRLSAIRDLSPSEREALIAALTEALQSEEAEQPGRLVSTGISKPGRPMWPLDRDYCLEPELPYLFWFAIRAAPVEGAIDDVPHALLLPADAVAGDPITVVLFDYPDELILTPGADVGTFAFDDSGHIRVTEQPTPTFTANDRLFFPIRTPARPGVYRLRCNVYCRGTLLQSRVLSVTVESGAPEREGALRVVVDYAVEATLDPNALAQLQPLRLSVFANSNDDGTHSFRFFAGTGLKATTLLTEGQIQDHIDRARRTLTMIAWGVTEYQEGKSFRYLAPGTVSTFDSDLFQMALSGYRLWTHVVGGLAQNAEPALPDNPRSPIKELQDRMRQPGMIEFANKVDATYTVPAALFYDYDLDTTVPMGQWRLCPDVSAAIRSRADLSQHRCFLGEGEHHETMVCPSGFWGFRHSVTLPQASAYRTGSGSRIASSASVDATHFIDIADQPRMLLGVATEFEGPHVAWVEQLGSTSRYRDAAQLLEAMRDSSLNPQLIYFFCHGSETNGIPALVFGPKGSLGIQYEAVASGNVYWRNSRPLVVLNACGTAAVQPRHAMTFVDAFVRRAKASGVIGTEITTDVRLGERFGRQFLDGFVTRRLTVADALRAARLALLAEGDPLGMAFVGYAAPQLRLRASTDPCTCGSGRTYGACHAPAAVGSV